MNLSHTIVPAISEKIVNGTVNTKVQGASLANLSAAMIASA